ncbi:MAG: LLM class F420-dependent oxidoreductase [Acidimicrobiia bacterium]
MAQFKVGISLHPQATDIPTLRAAWRELDAMGADSIWTWDHFYPLYGDPDAAHFECYSLLAAMAADTSHAQIGAMVTCNSYRNPNLLADMARTIDCISEGRFVLGLGSGWFERDYIEYGYTFGTAGDRLRQLEASLPVITERLSKLNPAPVGAMPILIGGSGEKVTLRIVAEHATMWNSFGPPDNFAHKNNVLTEWCNRIGRDPLAIERTVLIKPEEVTDWQAFLDAGAQHLIVSSGAPFPLEAVERLLEIARS